HGGNTARIDVSDAAVIIYDFRAALWACHHLVAIRSRRAFRHLLISLPMIDHHGELHDLHGGSGPSACANEDAYHTKPESTIHRCPPDILTVEPVHCLPRCATCRNRGPLALHVFIRGVAQETRIDAQN